MVCFAVLERAGSFSAPGAAIGPFRVVCSGRPGDSMEETIRRRQQRADCLRGAHKGLDCQLDLIVQLFECLQFHGKPKPFDHQRFEKRCRLVKSPLAYVTQMFLGRSSNVRKELLSRLKHIRRKFQDSPYFQTPEVRLLARAHGHIRRPWDSKMGNNFQRFLCSVDDRCRYNL